MTELPVLSIHTTDRGTFKRCRQQWQFSSNLQMNLEPIKPWEPFWFGTAFHAGVEAYYMASGNPFDVFQEHVDAWWKSIESPSIEDDERKKELTEMGVAMLTQYIAFAQVDDDFEVLWIERDFNIPIPGLERFPENTVRELAYQVLYSFRTDGLVKDEHGRLWILEHKTTSRFPGSTDYLLTDDQVGSYIWALEQVLGIKIEGVIYNWVRKAIPKPLKRLKNGTFSVDKSQDTTLHLALSALAEDYDINDLPQKYQDFIDHLKTKENNFVRRERVRRNRKEIQMIGEMLQYEVREMLNDPVIYRTPGAFNCNGCPFFAPCVVRWEGGDYKSILEQMFKKREPR